MAEKYGEWRDWRVEYNSVCNELTDLNNTTRKKIEETSLMYGELTNDSTSSRSTRSLLRQDVD